MGFTTCYHIYRNYDILIKEIKNSGSGFKKIANDSSYPNFMCENCKGCYIYIELHSRRK